MATQRRSLHALKMLKEQHQHRIRNYYRPKQRVIADKIRDSREEEAKQLIKDIEDLLTKKYPQLSKLLKCETGHSQFNNDRIEVGFKFKSTQSIEDENELYKLVSKEKQDFKELENWYTAFLEDCACGNELSQFAPAHLQGVSSEYNYQNDREVVV